MEQNAVKLNLLEENMTNAEKIRNMNDEELAKLITSGEMAAICPQCVNYNADNCCEDDTGTYDPKICANGIIKWLKTES